MLDNTQIAALRTHLKRNRVPLMVLGEGMSRRLEGECIPDAEREDPGYESVFVYVQSGLEDHHELFGQVLTCVLGVQSNSRFKYPVGLFSFGWDDGSLRHSGRMHEVPKGTGRNNLACNKLGKSFGKELASLSGAEALANVTVPALIPPGYQVGAKRRINSKALLVFFCRDRVVQMPPEVLTQYKKVRRRTVWFFLNELPLTFQHNFEPVESV